MKSIILSSIILIAALQLVAQEKKEIFFADTTIWVDVGKYYLTGTKGGGGTAGFGVLESKDLKNWAAPKGSSSPEYMILSKGDQSFGTGGFWAPQIFKADRKYYLSYTANEQTALAESKSFLGPYRQKEVGPIDGSVKNIDSFVFKDDDEKFYLYHVRFSNGNYIWVAEFDLETGKIKPETLTKCYDQPAPEIPKYTGVNDQLNDESNFLFPGLADEFVQFAKPFTNQVTGSIINTHGVEVKKLSGNLGYINVSQLAAGMYLVKVTDGSEIQTFRFIKK